MQTIENSPNLRLQHLLQLKTNSFNLFILFFISFSLFKKIIQTIAVLLIVFMSLTCVCAGLGYYARRQQGL